MLIRLLREPGIETLDKTILFRAPGDCAILVQNLGCTHCREQACLFRFAASIAAVNTTARSRGFVIVFPLRGRCRLRQMRCYYLCGVSRHIFSEAHLYCADTVFAVSRPVGAEETATSGTEKSVPYRCAAKNSALHCCSSRQTRFPTQSRTGLPEIYVSVGASNRL